MALIIDIETIGDDFESLDEITQHNLTRWIKREAGSSQERYNVLLQDVKEGLGFSPLTGEIAAIGVFDTEKNKGVVYFQAPDVEIDPWSEASFTFKTRTEAEMLKDFWQGIIEYKEIVSFNGRSFDIPFLMVRGAVWRIKPTLNLMARRYVDFRSSGVKHIDLFDQMTFYGAVRRKGNLHLFCQALGIKSPKAEGVTGDDIGRLFKEKEYKKIAEYNSWDLVATWELYQIWQDFFCFK